MNKYIGKTDIILVSFNRLNFLKKTIEAINERTTSEFRLIVIDNHSEQDVIDYLKWAKLVGMVHEVVFLEENVGQAMSQNIGFKMVTSKYFVLTQNDLICPKLSPDWLSRLIHLMEENTEAGCISMRINRTRRVPISENSSLIRNYKTIPAVFRIHRTEDTLLLGENPFGSALHWESSSCAEAMRKIGKKFYMSTKIYADHFSFSFENKGYEKEETEYHTYSGIEKNNQGELQPYADNDSTGANIPIKINHIKDMEEHEKRLKYWGIDTGIQSNQETGRKWKQRYELGQYVDQYCEEGDKSIDLGCFIGSTKIPLLDGTEDTLKNLSNRKGKFFVYSLDKQNNIVAGLAESRLTRKKTEVIKVILDNDEEIICTPDHLFMGRDGKYILAKDLKEKDSLMPLYRKLDKAGYELVYEPTKGNYNKTHWVLGKNGCLGKIKKIGGQQIHIHHININHRDNTPTNLRFIGSIDHAKLHYELGKMNYSKGIGSRKYEEKRKRAIRNKWKNDLEFRNTSIERATKNIVKYMKENKEEWLDKIKDNGKRGKNFLITYNKSEKGRNKSREVGKKSIQKLIELNKSEEARKRSSDIGKIIGPKVINKMLKALDENPKLRSMGGKVTCNRIQICDVCGKKFKGIPYYIHIKTCKVINHKVKSIEYVQKKQDVYCLSVEKYHNFGLSSGVFVHNCGSEKCNEKQIGIDIYPYPCVDILHTTDDLWFFEDNSIKVITASHHLEHLSDVKKVLNEWDRVLKPGGVLAFIVPDGEKRPSTICEPSHKYSFSTSMIHRLIRKYLRYNLLRLGPVPNIAERKASIICVAQKPLDRTINKIQEIEADLSKKAKAEILKGLQGVDARAAEKDLSKYVNDAVSEANSSVASEEIIEITE